MYRFEVKTVLEFASVPRYLNLADFITKIDSLHISAVNKHL